MRVPVPTTWPQAFEFAYERKKLPPGSTTARGYGWKHQQARAKLLAKAGGKKCARCGKTLTPGTADAGHATKGGSASRLECRHCNRSAGGRARHGLAAKPS